MASQRGQKRQLELARLEKAKQKRERRQGRAAADEASADADGASRPPQAEVIAALADLHRRYADEELSLEDFESLRAELTDQLQVD